MLGLLRKRTSAVNGALTTLEGGLSCSTDGHEVLMSLDGREALIKGVAEILSGPELCEKKLEDTVRQTDLSDKSVSRHGGTMSR